MSIVNRGEDNSREQSHKPVLRDPKLGLSFPVGLLAQHDILLFLLEDRFRFLSERVIHVEQLVGVGESRVESEGDVFGGGGVTTEGGKPAATSEV